VYQNILVPVDGSVTATRGLKEAIRIAKSHNARLRLLHVVNEIILIASDPQPALFTNSLLDSLRDGGKAILKSAEGLVREQGLAAEAVLLETWGRHAADLIIEQAEQWPADLIVMGTHGRRGLRRLVLGSDAELVLRTANVPVLLVRCS
jgi:nucleotide-binding universal stress UspA family protein